MDALAVDVESVELRGQQKYADVCRRTEVDEVEDAVFVRPSDYDAEQVLGTRCATHRNN